MISPLDAETSFITFAERDLGFSLYDWQCRVVEPFDEASERLVQVSVCTPNGSGKSAVVIPTLALGWLAVYSQGRVVITTADGKQLDGQVMPAIKAHRAKFDGWKFIEREVSNGTGGMLMAFTTDQAGRAEGWHKLNDREGPLLIIADEAKTVPDSIFDAIDRCTFNAILLASSTGYMVGRFYESQTTTPGYIRIKVRLAECPHIGQEKIERIIAQHGADSAFTRSTLHSEFMEDAGESRFDRDGLAVLRAQAEAGVNRANLGTLQHGYATGRVIWQPDDAGWLWLDEEPQPGGEYLLACDPNTCEQGEGGKDRDNTACCVLRKAYLGESGTEYPDAVVAALHWPGGVKWDSDVLAARMKLLADWYGDAMAVVEANNFGSALIKELQREGVRLWRRTRVDDHNPNKTVTQLGYLTTERTREHWVQACAKALRCQNGTIGLTCRYRPAVDEFHTFIFLPTGRAEAQPGTKDDWVACVGLGLTVRCFNQMPKVRRERALSPRMTRAQNAVSVLSPFGSCG